MTQKTHLLELLVRNGDLVLQLTPPHRQRQRALLRTTAWIGKGCLKFKYTSYVCTSKTRAPKTTSTASPSHTMAPPPETWLYILPLLYFKECQSQQVSKQLLCVSMLNKGPPKNASKIKIKQQCILYLYRALQQLP